MMGRKYDKAVETRFYANVNGLHSPTKAGPTSKKKVAAKP